MKKVMKKKLVSTVLAAIMSVTALAGTVMNANAEYKLIVSNDDKKRLDDSELIKHYGNSYTYVFTRCNSTGRSYYYNGMAFSRSSFAKVCYVYDRIDYHYEIKTQHDSKRFHYSLPLNKKNNGVKPVSDGNSDTLTLHHETLWYIQGNNIYYNGDANHDGVVDIDDALKALDYIRGRSISSLEFFLADVNNDNEVDIEDVSAIILHINGERRIN